MNAIKLLRNAASARAHNPGASLPPAPRPPQPGLEPEWWTAGWSDATAPLDERCEQIFGDLKLAYERVRDYSDPLGTPFFEFDLGELLPTALWQGILRIPDEFAHGVIVLRKVKAGDAYSIRVCDPQGGIVGMVEPCELLNLDHWLETCAHWLLASNRVNAEMIRATLKKHLP